MKYLIALALALAVFGSQAVATPLHLKRIPIAVEYDGPRLMYATALSIPNSFSSGQIIQSALVNANFTAISSWSTNIDSTNIGAAGINASKIVCSTLAACTFGSSGVALTLPTGLIFGPSAITSPANVACWNDNAPTNGLVCNVPTGSTNGFSLDANGTVVASISVTGKGTFVGLVSSAPNTFSAETDFTGSTITITQVAIGADAGATKGLLFNVPTGSTNGFQFQTNGVTKVQIDNAGNITSQANLKTTAGANINLGTTVIDLFLGQAAAPLSTNAYPTVDVDASNHIKVTKEFVRCLTPSSSGSVTFTFTGTTLPALVLPVSTSTASATVASNDMAGNSILVTASGGTGEAQCAVKLTGTVAVN